MDYNDADYRIQIQYSIFWDTQLNEGQHSEDYLGFLEVEKEILDRAH